MGTLRLLSRLCCGSGGRLGSRHPSAPAHHSPVTVDRSDPHPGTALDAVREPHLAHAAAVPPPLRWNSRIANTTAAAAMRIPGGPPPSSVSAASAAVDERPAHRPEAVRRPARLTGLRREIPGVPGLSCRGKAFHRCRRHGMAENEARRVPGSSPPRNAASGDHFASSWTGWSAPRQKGRPRQRICGVALYGWS